MNEEITESVDGAETIACTRGLHRSCLKKWLAWVSPQASSLKPGVATTDNRRPL